MTASSRPPAEYELRRPVEADSFETAIAEAAVDFREVFPGAEPVTIRAYRRMVGEWVVVIKSPPYDPRAPRKSAEDIAYDKITW